MTSNVTIRVDEPESDEKGNGHLTRRDGSFRRTASSRRSRSTPAIDSTVNEEAAGVSRGSRRSHGPREHEPGLRSMLYGLHQKLEKEEAAMKKRQRKQHSMFPFLVYPSQLPARKT
ncbi:hypothetical protein RB195_018370 [Necator americanus]|uniref:Uncharacterized protein n=1 Tax=Necator americanus TaxID=51031 RepID=A0ABR1C9G5_NECAM